MNTALQLPRLVFADGAVNSLPDELDHLGIRRALLLTDQGLVRLGHLARVRERLKHRDEHPVFATVPQNPTVSIVDEATRMYRRDGCDGVVAIGGGSVIDTAKLVAVLGSHSGTALDYLHGLAEPTNSTAPIVAIPTTAGTGSEASPDAGIHPDTQSCSLGVSSPFIIPRVAICDPQLTLSLPPRLTAATALDALSHCVEGYLSNTDSPIADMMAIDGIRRICSAVKTATQTGDIEARRELMLAAFEGGVVIGKGLGPAHAIAICCGDQGLHHGLLSALGLVATMRLLQDKVPKKLAQIEAAMALPGNQTAAGTLLRLMGDLGLPTSLAQMGYKVGSIDQLASNCERSHFNRTSPYVPSRLEYVQMVDGILH